MLSAPAVAAVLGKLAEVEALLGHVLSSDVLTNAPTSGGAADTAALAPITAALRRIEGRCAALGVSIASLAKAAGDDPGATLLGQGKVSGRRARQEATRADVAERMPELGQCLHSGAASGEHLDAVARARADLSDDESALFDQLAPELARAAEKLPVDTFARQVRRLVDDARADHGLTRLQQQRARSELKLWTTDDGMGHLHLTADAERFAIIQTAIENETASLAAAARKEAGPLTKGPALQLDALVELVGRSRGGPGRANVLLLVDSPTLTDGPHHRSVCQTAAGADLPIDVVQRHLCDAVVQRVTLDDASLPIDVGRTYRTATRAQWAALQSIYATCAWDRCDRPITWTQAHHVHEWEHGGPTDLENLVPLCSRHHQMVHDGGWRLRLRADRLLEIHRPAADLTSARTERHQHQKRHPPQLTAASLWATTFPDRLPDRLPIRSPTRTTRTSSASGVRRNTDPSRH